MNIWVKDECRDYVLGNVRGVVSVVICSIHVNFEADFELGGCFSQKVVDIEDSLSQNICILILPLSI